MDLKVFVEGVLREVCGVTECTTCEEIIIKLAQASNLPGFYTLVANFRETEYTLSADEKVVSFFRRMQENPSNVHLILRRLEAPPHPSRTRTENKHRPTGMPPQRQLSNVVFSEPNENRSPSLQTPSLKPEKRSNQAMAIDSKNLSQAASLQVTGFESDEYEQLQDRLAYQEQEVELNRIRLLQLDKEIAEFERSNRLNSSLNDQTLSVGPAAELAQLSTTPWPQLLEANRSRQTDLLAERDRYQLAVERVDAELQVIKNEIAPLEAKMSHDLEGLLSTLEAANMQRRQLLRSLSPSSTGSRPSALLKNDGVAV